MKESRYRLKHWLQAENKSNNWGWQVIVDSLAIGESLPIRLICYASLRDLYDLLVESLKLAEIELDNCASKSHWDEHVQEVISWAEEIPSDTQAENIDESIRARNYRVCKTLKLISDIYPSLASKIFPVLPANPFPMEMLSRISFQEYRVFCLLWFYHWIIIRDQIPYKPNETVKLNGGALALPTMNMTSQWLNEYISEVKAEHEKLNQWLIIIGPNFGGNVSMLSEANYHLKIIEPVVKSIKYFSSAIDSDRFHHHRFKRAAQEATPLPWAELTHRQHRISFALTILLNFEITIPGKTLTHHDVYHMTLWALFNIKHKREIKELLVTPGASLRFHHGEDYIPTPEEETMRAHYPACLSTHLGPSNNHQLTMLDERGKSVVNLDLVEDQILEFGFFLECEENRCDESELHSMRLLCSYLHIHAYNERRKLDNKRLLIVSDRLHRELGGVVKSDGSYPSLGICEWLTGMLRSEATFLYRYETQTGKDSPLTGVDSFFVKGINKDYQKKLFAEVERIATTDERHTSVVYRAVDENNSQICLAYDSKTKQSIPAKNTLMLVAESTEPCSALVVPVRFNGRLQGAIMVSASAPWQFSWGQQVVLEQSASIIAPYFYQQRFLRALNTINQTVLKFHHDLIKEQKLYEEICEALAILFLCDGASFWVRKENEGHLLAKKGSHNIVRTLNEIDLNIKGIVSSIVMEAEQQSLIKTFRTFVLKNIDIYDNVNVNELTGQGVKHVALLPLIERDARDTKKVKVTAVISLYTRDEIGFGASWNAIMGYMGGFLAFVVEAVNAFVHQRQLVTDAVQHEIWHDAAYLTHKATEIARQRNDLKERLERLTQMVKTPWFLDRQEVSKLLGKWTNRDIEEVKSLQHAVDASWFLPQQDMQHFADTLKTRIEALFSVEDLNKESRGMLPIIGDRSIVQLINVNEIEIPVDLKATAKRLLEKHQEISKKNLQHDISVQRGHFALGRPTIIDTVLRNLLDNAIKYSTPGSFITFETEVRKNGGMRLIIINEGKAMTNIDECCNVVQKGVRGSNAVGVLGRGLGLYVVRMLCAHVLRYDFYFEGEPLRQREGVKYIATLDIPANRVMKGN